MSRLNLSAGCPRQSVGHGWARRQRAWSGQPVRVIDVWCCARQSYASRMTFFPKRMTSVRQLGSRCGLCVLIAVLHGLTCIRADTGLRPWFPDSAGIDRQWTSDLQQLWLRAESKVAFCFGSSQRSLLKLLQASFPFPLPTGPPEDAFCSNATAVSARLCRPQEIEYYYKVSKVSLPCTFHDLQYTSKHIRQQQSEPHLVDQTSSCTLSADQPHDSSMEHPDERPGIS